ncbi:histidine phosphatase family protein [Agrococcus sp. SCSIO52902]|uniref:histidine phosphatase family protein n=1 Tax=Agrococcus sp. SCSIO52902 TaxID=2933290 RepID=UPI001FF3E7A7|nr:histidine phosphatase family protein [Agrococcus sp. SCSIO52902]UOW01394.1 histidine phosphatase family protein [Agrococcus sp. SCSIO52902]
MQIALVRHGQTDFNRDGRLQGSSDIPLNETGIAQAHTAARLLAGEHWGAVVSSPLERAAVTADIIAAALGLEVCGRYPSLIERAYGQAEGLTKEQAVERFGTDWPGEEDFDDLQRRAVAAIDEVAAANPVEALVIVTHGTFIRAFTDHVTGLETRTPDNAHSVRFAGTPGAWQLVDGLVRK